MHRPFQNVIFSTVHIENVCYFYSCRPDKMCASAYERCPLYRTLKLNTGRTLLEKLSELHFEVGIRRWTIINRHVPVYILQYTRRLINCHLSLINLIKSGHFMLSDSRDGRKELNERRQGGGREGEGSRSHFLNA